MSKLFKNVTPMKFVLLESSMLLPTVIFAVVMWNYRFPLLAVLLYLLFCNLLFPFIYMRFILGKYSSEAVQLLGTLTNVYLDTKKHIKFGLIGFFISGILVSLGLYISLSFLDIWQVSGLNMLWLPNTEIIILSLILVFLVPFLNEFFWRCFLQTALVGGLTYSNPPELISWYIAFHYALMFAFIFDTFTTQIGVGFLCALPFALFSRKLTYFRDTGLLAAVLTHMGMSVGFVIILNIWYWQNLPL